MRTPAQGECGYASGGHQADLALHLGRPEPKDVRRLSRLPLQKWRWGSRPRVQGSLSSQPPRPAPLSLGPEEWKDVHREFAHKSQRDTLLLIPLNTLACPGGSRTFLGRRGASQSLFLEPRRAHGHAQRDRAPQRVCPLRHCTNVAMALPVEVPFLMANTATMKEHSPCAGHGQRLRACSPG